MTNHFQANIVDNLDGRMTQAVLTSDNVNNYIYNNNANDQWIRYYNQWHTNNQRLQQQPIANTVVSQSLEVTGPVLPQQTQDQSPGQQQPQVPLFYLYLLNPGFQNTFRVKNIVLITL